MKKLYLILILFIILGCSENSPIGGAYLANDNRLSAIIVDSTLYMMIGVDTMIIYKLQIKYDTKHLQDRSDNAVIFRTYNVVYSNSLDRDGYRNIELPFVFNHYDQGCGGTLMANFNNNDYFSLGGYRFDRLKNADTVEKMLNTWSDLLANNTDEILRTQFY